MEHLPPLPCPETYCYDARVDGDGILRFTENQMQTFARQAVKEAMERVQAELDELRKNGPPMSRGTRGDGVVWMGTMRDCLKDAKQAADVEARLGDEARAELAAAMERCAVICTDESVDAAATKSEGDIAYNLALVHAAAAIRAAAQEQARTD